MAIIKATLFFENRTHGWTESFLWQAADDNLQAANNSLQVISQKRAALLGEGAKIKAQRVSVETDNAGQPRLNDSYLTYINYLGSPGHPAGDDDLAVLVTMRNANAQRRRNMFLRGIWDELEVAGGQLDLGTPGWLALYNSWQAAMLARGVGWFAGDRQTPLALSTYDFDSVTGYTKVTLADPIPVVVPNQLRQARFQGVNGKSALNGLHLIRVIDATHVWIERPLALADYTFGGKMTLYGRHFEVAATIDPQKIVTRRVGAPLLQSRGRARVETRI